MEKTISSKWSTSKLFQPQLVHVNKFIMSSRRALFVVRKRVFEPIYQFEPFFKLTKFYEIRKRSTDGMRSFIKQVLRKRIAELSNTDQMQKKDDNEKRLRIFIDEIIQLSLDQKCFTEEEMITESLTMLLAVI